jgi:hypothetical protein
VLRQMFDRKPEPSRSGRAEHQPVRAFREILIRERFAEQRVIYAEIFYIDPGLRHAGAAARFKYVNGPVGKTARHPSAHRAAAQPFVLKRAELAEIGVALNLAARVEIKSFGKLKPEGRAGFRVEMPPDNFSRPGIELLVRRSDLCLHISVSGWFHSFALPVKYRALPFDFSLPLEMLSSGYFNPEGSRGEESSFLNSSQRFAGRADVPPLRSM